MAEAAAQAGALLQMQDGSMWTYSGADCDGLCPCGPGANFPVPCSYMLPTPAATVQQLGGSCNALGPQAQPSLRSDALFQNFVCHLLDGS